MPASEEFVSELLQPGANPSAARMSRGEPGLPAQFRWRGKMFQIATVQQTWKTSTPDRGELYLRRHWYRITTATGEVMTLYCLRQARSFQQRKARWWVYSVTACTDRDARR
jgi:hypothetical protein